MELRPTPDESDDFSRSLLSTFHRDFTAEVRRRYEPIDGYGVATRAARLTARRPEAVLLQTPGAGAPLSAGPAGDHLEAMRSIHEWVRRERPGMLDRPDAWWQDRLYDPEGERGGAQALRAVVTDDGYAVYAVRPEWGDNGPAGEVRMRELAEAGRVRELRPGALARAAVAFRGDAEPWSPEMF